jgi:beta-glucosidase
VSDIYITENGCSATDVPAADGVVYDTDRIMFLRSYLTQLQRATSEGVPVRGYFHWSLMDNFEWADGFGTRFGLLYVDYASQQRTPKLSASFYRGGRRAKPAGVVRSQRISTESVRPRIFGGASRNSHS